MKLSIIVAAIVWGLRVNAWTYEAHHVVAGVAQSILEKYNPHLVQRAESVIRRLNNT